MNKKVNSWIVSLVLLVAVIVTVWIYYPTQDENISTGQEEKVKKLLMTSSAHINSGMESVQRIGELEDIPSKNIKK